MAPNTTAAHRAVICTMKRLGSSNDDIRTALVGRHDISDRQIHRIFVRYGDKENYNDVGQSSGRPRKLSGRDTRVALRHLSNQDCVTASDLQREYFPQVSVATLKRTLREQGLHAYVKASVPFITKKNLHVRKKWAEEYLEWTVPNWMAVTFSDESNFHIFGSDGIQWCWRKPGQRLDPRYTKKKLKHGGGKVVVWGMITPFGVGRIVRIEGNLNKELYVDILQDDVLGTFSDLDLDSGNFYFQQDHDPKHTSKVAQQWFVDNHIDLLPWPANSPDINIIENLWDHLSRRVHARRPQPTSETDLWILLQEEWYRIEPSFISKLYNSLPQ